MDWKRFLELAYPPDLRIEDLEKRTTIFRWHRRIGLYLGFFLYNLGISANFIGISRIFVALFSLFLISKARHSEMALPFLGVLFLYSQHILDQCDGVIARAAGKVNKLGERLDGISNAFSRHGMVILLATFTKNMDFIVFGTLVSFICVTVRDLFLMDKIAYDNDFKGFAIFFRLIFSIQAMLFILPMLIIINNALGWNVKIFSYVAISLYGCVTAVWFYLSFHYFYKNKK